MVIWKPLPYPFTNPTVFGICLSCACHMTMSVISFGSLSYPCHILVTTQKRYTCHIPILKKIFQRAKRCGRYIPSVSFLVLDCMSLSKALHILVTIFSSLALPNVVSQSNHALNCNSISEYHCTAFIKHSRIYLVQAPLLHPFPALGGVAAAESTYTGVGSVGGRAACAANRRRGPRGDRLRGVPQRGVSCLLLRHATKRQGFGRHPSTCSLHVQHVLKVRQQQGLQLLAIFRSCQDVS